MRRYERDVLLLMLAAAAGSADGWSYFALGHSFVANMTGNTVLLGIAVFLHGDLLHPGISLVCYLAGAVLAAFFTRNVREGNGWPRAVSKTLALEAALLAAAEVGWALAGRSGTPPGSTAALNILLGCVALAIGIQSGAHAAAEDSGCRDDVYHGHVDKSDKRPDALYQPGAAQAARAED